MNAFTAKECTCYYAKVIAEHLPRAMDLLCDMLLNARVDEAEFEKERGVILEEIAMCEDTPEDLVYDLLAEAYFGEHPLARPILGSHDQIASIGREALLTFKKKHYRPDNTVLAIAGQFDRTQFRDMAERLLGGWHAEGETHIPGAGGEHEAAHADAQKGYRAGAHVSGVPRRGAGQRRAVSHQRDEQPVRRAACHPACSSAFVREMGAAYSVYSFPSTYTNCGTFTVYAGTSPETAQKVADELHNQIRLLRDGGVNAGGI